VPEDDDDDLSPEELGEWGNTTRYWPRRKSNGRHAWKPNGAKDGSVIVAAKLIAWLNRLAGQRVGTPQ